MQGRWLQYKNARDSGKRNMKGDVSGFNRVGSHDELVKGVFWPEDIYMQAKGEDGY